MLLTQAQVTTNYSLLTTHYPLLMPITALHRFGPKDMNPGEIIIYRAHLSFPAFLIRSKPGVFFMLIGLAVFFLAWMYGDVVGFLVDTTVTVGILLFASLPFVYGLIRFATILVDWLYDEDVITNQRVIDYNQKFLFNREQSTANMKSVENVILFQKGIFRTLFDYGSLDVQTAATSRLPRPGELNEFLVLDDVRHPKKLQRLIDEIANRVKNGVLVDREEMLIMCGLKQGDLDEYFVIKKSRGWKSRVKKLLNWK